MRSSIEFHDSTITSIAIVGTSIRISLNAYVHRWDMVGETWKGTGWIQPVQIVLMDAAGGNLSELPVNLFGGEIRAGQVRHNNLVPLPFRSPGAGSLRLELVTGEVLEFSGHSIALEPTGEGQYLEDLPDDFKPSDAG